MTTMISTNQTPMTTVIKTTIAALLLALAAGCTHATMTTPNGFARVDGPYDVRAVNAVGVIVGSRIEKNDPQANLEFWASAVDLKLARQGYNRLSAADVKSQEGVPGKLFKYDAGNYQEYWVAVFVTNKHVRLTEATGHQAHVASSAKQLESAMLSAHAG
jgi:hypothetical protein